MMHLTETQEQELVIGWALVPNTLRFTVQGVPIGYKRTTQRAKYCEDYKRYQQYKDLVVLSFLEQCVGDWGVSKPLTTVKGQKTKVDIKIYFKDFTHGDPDNVFKAIADAIFENDKYCCGSFDYFYDHANPRVEIQIS